MREILLNDIAHGRSGDKGDTSNICVFARKLKHALGGGATMSLRLDSLGKSMGSAIMRLKIHVKDEEL